MLCRRQLYELSTTRWQIEAELRAGRWRALGRQTIRVADGDPDVALWWTAIFEVGVSAVLDGVTALFAAGLRGITEPTVHVAVPKSADPRRFRGVTVHETRRYDHDAVIRHGIPRMKPATAAVHACLWARSEKQAGLFVLAAAQQRLFTPDEFGVEVLKVRRDRRRLLLHALFEDISSGIETLGERQFAKLCAARGFPKPTRQVRRRTAQGTWILDVEWGEFKVTVEIDGAHHLDPAAWISDALKQNVVTLRGHAVFRVPNVALWIDPEPFLDQIEAALRRGGWQGPAATLSA